MRLYAAMIAIGLLALSALLSDAEPGHGIPASGAELCGRTGLERDKSGGEWLKGLVRVTCDLDGALLWMQSADRADPGNGVMGRLHATRQRPVR